MKFIKYLNLGASDNEVSLYAEKFGIDKKVIEILFNRGYRTEQQFKNFLQPTLQELQSPYTMDCMEESVQIIKKAIIENKKIVVFGDYDVDGISASAIMIKTFKKLKANASYFLPNRYRDGYGLTTETLKKVIKFYSPDLIITVDCGITAVEEVEYLKSKGILVIITDHHELGDKLPDCPVINTKKTNQEYSFRGLCGTGVAYKLSQALIGDDADEFLPIVALATIADIVPLVSENRTLVSKGLKMLDKLPLGLRSLFSENKVSLKNPSSTDIAFKITPKLNASGRMGDANDSIKLYFETNPQKIKEQIAKINEHNLKRQELCNKVFDDSIEMLQNQNLSKVPAIILYSKEWDSGILGIVCSKLLEKYHRPVFLFAEDDGTLKGSARSIQDINIHNILTSVKDILDVFGGHTMAAGLTLQKDKFNEFVNRVNSYIIENIDNKVFVPVEYYDLDITLGDLNPKFLSDLKLLEPCGCENTTPKFLIKTDKITVTPLKNFPCHANITIGKNLNLIYFNYLQESSKLNFGSEYKFIFDLQEYNKNIFKGMVKSFDCSYGVKPMAQKYLESFIVNQLQNYNSDKDAEYSFYKNNMLLDFVMDMSISAFGTLFVATSIKSFNEFIQSYDVSRIYDYSIINGLKTGFNGIVLAPSDLEPLKNYKKIIFLDPVLNLDYIKKINEISKAKIFLPQKQQSPSTLLNGLNMSREHFALIYENLKKIQNKKFNSVISIYSYVCKNLRSKIDFNNFIVPFSIFEELNIISTIKTPGNIQIVLNDIKSDIKLSSIYNNLNLINKISH